MGCFTATHPMTSLHGTVHPNITKVLDLPAYERLHMGHLCTIIINTTFNRTYVTPWASHLGSLVGQSYGAHPGYIEDRNNFCFESAPSSEFRSRSPHAPVRSMWVRHRPLRSRAEAGSISAKSGSRGCSQPLEVAWSAGRLESSFADTWEVTVPVTAGTNPTYRWMAYDYQGVP